MTGARRDRAWRLRRLADARVYLCTDGRDARGDLAEFLDAVLGAGVDMVQLRDKDADGDALASAAAVTRAAALRHGALFVLNDDPQLAAAVDADGVHVGQDDAPVRDARGAVGPDRIVGLSTHGDAQFDAGLATHADYLAVGPVTPTPTKPGRAGIGLDPVRHAAAVADRPWFVTGGMAADTVEPVLGAGARRVVVVRAITEAADPAAAAAAVVRRVRAAG